MGVFIVKTRRTGQGSLEKIERLGFPNYLKGRFSAAGPFNNDNIYVVLIRNVIDKWKSGYISEFKSFREPESHLKSTTKKLIRHFGSETYNHTTYVGLDVEELGFLHNVNSNLKWMYSGHAEFWNWGSYDLTLFEMAWRKNVYFVELNDLSNPRFLEWLQEMDEKWKEVKEIPHENNTSETQIKLFLIVAALTFAASITLIYSLAVFLFPK